MLKNKIKSFIQLSILSFILAHEAFPQANPTPDFWQCPNRIGGNWVFGQAPSACDVDPFADARVLIARYPNLVYIDAADGSVERRRFMQEIHAVLRDAAEYYIKRRKPSVDATEIESWKRAILAVAHQESFFTHYRNASDGRLKFMRGDFGHGHGLMQVDDRWHFVAVSEGKAVQLVSNIIYSLEEYYAGWERAPRSGCLDSPTNYRDRARAAYGAYNGGPSKICRWTNPNDVWARNDINFLEKWNQRAWVSFVADPNKKSSVNVSCLAEGGIDCAAPNPSPAPTPQLSEDLIYKRANGQFCLLDRGRLSCIEKASEVACLIDSNRKVRAIADLPREFETNTPFDLVNRHIACASKIAGLQSVGSGVELKKDIWFRSEPGGEQIRIAPRGTIAQTLDFQFLFQVNNAQEEARYYRLELDGRTGYIFAGNASDFATWVTPSPRALSAAELRGIAMPGRNLVTRKGQINLRNAIGGNIITQVPSGTRLRVEARELRGTENFIYYLVTYRGSRGWIYGGRILPERDNNDWISPE
jgi:hypothetical protein